MSRNLPKPHNLHHLLSDVDRTRGPDGKARVEPQTLRALLNCVRKAKEAQARGWHRDALSGLVQHLNQFTLGEDQR
jgi:hypothetical protein